MGERDQETGWQVKKMVLGHLLQTRGRQKKEYSEERERRRKRREEGHLFQFKSSPSLFSKKVHRMWTFLLSLSFLSRLLFHSRIRVFPHFFSLWPSPPHLDSWIVTLETENKEKVFVPNFHLWCKKGKRRERGKRVKREGSKQKEKVLEWSSRCFKKMKSILFSLLEAAADHHPFFLSF